MYGAGEESRTPDLRITNALLYQLSYTGFADCGRTAGKRLRTTASKKTAITCKQKDREL